MANVRCVFCGISEQFAKRMVSNPSSDTQLRICGECVAVCYELITKDDPDPELLFGVEVQTLERMTLKGMLTMEMLKDLVERALTPVEFGRSLSAMVREVLQELQDKDRAELNGKILELEQSVSESQALLDHKREVLLGLRGQLNKIPASQSK